MSNIEGLDGLLATLSGLGGNIKESCRIGLERGAKRIQKNAKLLSPVKTGYLRNSIKTKSQIIENGAEAQVFTNAEYAKYVEFGTGQRGMASDVQISGISYNAKWKGMRAQPFLVPAFLHARDNGTVEKELVKTVQSEIKKMESGKQ